MPQPNYIGDRFVRGDAIAYLENVDLSQFDFIWASPPCQRYTSIRRAPGKHRDADLVAPTRDALILSGEPYVIENVEGAPLIDPIVLYGTMFDLKTPDGRRALPAAASCAATAAIRRSTITSGPASTRPSLQTAI